MLNFITNGIAWFLKNVNMLVGVISAIVKAIVSLINIFQPSKDGLVDKITAIGEKIQSILFKGSELLKKFKGFTG